MGCRRRGAKSDLLRVVAVDGALAVDRRGGLPGRGAYLHPELACLELAERRQVFRRALRTRQLGTESFETGPIRQYCEGRSNVR